MMSHTSLVLSIRLALTVTLSTVAALPAAADPQTLEPVEVTTSKIPIALGDVAANVRVVGGPASSVPALWGLSAFERHRIRPHRDFREARVTANVTGACGHWTAAGSGASSCLLREPGRFNTKADRSRS